LLCPICYANLARTCNICKKEFIPNRKYQYLCNSCLKKRTVKSNPKKENKLQDQENLEENIEKKDRTIEILIKALYDEDTQQLAVEKLAEMGNEAAHELIEKYNKKMLRPMILKIFSDMGDEAFPILFESLDDIEYIIRRNSTKILRDIKDKRAVEPLITALNDSDSFVRRSAAKALGRIGDKRAVQHLINSLEDNNSSVRIASANAIQLIDPEISVEYLIRLLNDRNPKVRIFAAKSLGELKSEESLDSLKDEYLNEKNPVVLEALHKAICIIKSEDYLTNLDQSANKEKKIDKEEFLKLVEKLSEDDPEIRKNAIKSLGNINNEKSAEYLVDFLNDDNIEVKIEAINSLGKLKSKIAIKPLIRLLKDEEITVSWTAEESLVNFGIDALDDISECIINGDDRTRYMLVSVLGEINDDRSKKLLINLLNDDDFDVRIKTMEILGENKSEGSLDYLANLLDDEDISIRKSAIKAITKIGGEKSLEILKEALKGSDNLIKDKMISSINKIEKRIKKKAIGIDKSSDDAVTEEKTQKSNIKTKNESKYDIKDPQVDDDPFILLDEISKS